MTEDARETPSLVERGVLGMRVVENATTDMLHALKTRVVGDAQTVRAALGLGIERGVSILKKLVMFYVVLIVALCLLGAVLLVCLWLAGATAFGVRYYTLRHVAGNQVVPLAFNAMPLFTEWWRNKPVDDAMIGFLPSVQRAHRAELGLRRPRSGNGEAKDNAREDELVEDAVSLPGSVGHSELVNAQSGKLLDFKLGFFKQYVNSVLATSTLHVSTGNKRTLFFPGGLVNPEAIFDFGAPMFNALGEYSGSVQLVFLRENVGRDVSIVVESAVLFAEDKYSSQSLAALDVLFRRTQTVTVRTGELPHPFLVRAAAGAARLYFYPFVRTYEVVQRLLLDFRSAPFEPINHEHEVAVTVDLYKRFIPPQSLQSRLRAMNFTVYFNHLNEDGALPERLYHQRPKLARLSFYSRVQLRGFAYALTSYPLLSFAAMTAVIFCIYATITLVALSVGGTALYLNFARAAPQDAADSRPKWTFDANRSFSSSGLSPTTPAATYSAMRRRKQSSAALAEGTAGSESARAHSTRATSPPVLSSSGGGNTSPVTAPPGFPPATRAKRAEFKEEAEDDN